MSTLASLFWTTIDGFNHLVLVYFFLLNSVYLATSVAAFRELRAYVRRMKSIDVHDLLTSAGTPPVTIIAPAYNEETTCIETLRALLTLNYPELEILLVNDGSRDATLQRIAEEFELEPTLRFPTATLSAAPVRGTYRSRRHPNLWVVDKENGGRADALNAGLNFCRTPLFCVTDADSILERDALIRIVRPFLEDASTIAAGGIIRVANGCAFDAGAIRDVRLPRRFLAQMQVLEYLRSFLYGRVGWNAINATFIISGAFGMFRRSIVVDAGGFATDTVGEDMELTLRLHRYCRDRGIPYRTTFVPDPVLWTEVPETWDGLGRQRDRWQRGLMELLLKHRGMLFNPRYGRMGFLAYPYLLFLEMLGGLIEFLGYISFAVVLLAGRVTPHYVLAFLLLSLVFGVALSVAAVALEELGFRRYTRARDFGRLFLLAVLENFGHRQLLAYWRFRGSVSFLRGVKGWGGSIERVGFQAEAA